MSEQTTATTTIHHFHKVTPHLFRSAQPLLSQYQQLVDHRIGTVINLRGELGDDAINTINKHLDKLSIKHMHIPLIDTPPAKKIIDEYIDLVRSGPKNDKGVLVHCAFGRDRTGFFIGSWRVLGEQWDFARTYEEMLHYGFTPGFTNFTAALREWSKK